MLASTLVVILTPSLKYRYGNGIGKIKRSIVRAHRQSDALRFREVFAYWIWEASAFRTEKKPITWLILCVEKARAPYCRQGENPLWIRGSAFEKCIE